MMKKAFVMGVTLCLASQSHADSGFVPRLAIGLGDLVSKIDAPAMVMELAATVGPPNAGQLDAAAQFSDFVFSIPQLDWHDQAQVNAFAVRGGRAGRCLVVRFGVPNAQRVAAMVEGGFARLNPGQVGSYRRIRAQIDAVAGNVGTRSTDCDGVN